MQTITDQLQALGLSDYEARIYAVLVASSPACASSIAKKCGLSRSSVYTTLSALISKGLVGTTYKNDVKQFVAEDYSALETLLQKEKSDLEKRTKLFESMKRMLEVSVRTDAQTPHVVFFEGQEGLKKIYLSMMRTAPKNSVRYLLRSEFVWQSEWQFGSEWNARIDRWKKEKNIMTKLLVNPSLVEKSKKNFYAGLKDHEVRYLDARHVVSDYGLYIIGDTVAILSIEKNNFVGIQITNRHLAENFLVIFENLWKSAK